MAGILDIVKYGLASLGGTGLRSLSAANPTLGGKVGKAVDIVGRFLSNPLPETYASEYVESRGGQPKEGASYEDIRKIEEKAKQRAGFPSARGVTQQKEEQVKNAPSNMSVNPNTLSNLKHEIAMGANVGDVREFGGNKWRWNGEVWEPLGVSSSSSSGQRSDNDIRQEAINLLSQGQGQGFVGEGDIEQILNDVRNKGLGVADAIERRKIENAENRYRTMMDILGRQKGEASQLASEQRQGLAEKEQFYKGELEKRKQAELDVVEKMKPEEEKNYEALRDDTAGAYNEAVRRFQAAARATGSAVSGWSLGEEKRMLNEFNRNLSKIAITHQETLQKINDAIKETIDTYDSKVGELEYETRENLKSINQWERQQISAIQNQEDLTVAQKFEEINNAINMAEQLRLSIEQQYGAQITAYKQWLQQLQVNMALSAQAAAQNRIIEAQKLAEKQRKEALELQKWAISQGLYQTAPSGGGYKLYYYNPSSGQMEESGNVTPNVANTLEDLLKKKTTISFQNQIPELTEKINQQLGSDGGGSW